MRKARSLDECPSQQELHKLFKYQEGDLIWRQNSKFTKNLGRVAGGRKPDGYWAITINHKSYKRSRLVWAYHNGWAPENILIDHINNNKTDDCIENLRLVSVAENRWNSLNIKGYTYAKDREKYKATIMANGKRKLLGYFDTEDEAHLAYTVAKLKYHSIGQAQEHPAN